MKRKNYTIDEKDKKNRQEKELKDQFKKGNLTIKTNHIEHKLYQKKMVVKHIKTETLIDNLMNICELDKLQQVGKIISDQYINYYEKYEDLDQYIRHNTDIYRKIEKYGNKLCKGQKYIEDIFDIFIFDILEIHFYNYSACIEWINFHKTEPIEYILGNGKKGMAYGYKMNDTQIELLIYEICSEFIQAIKNEYQKIKEYIQYWFKYKISGKESQLSILKKYIIEYIGHKIKNTYIDSDLISKEIDKETDRLLNKIENYKSNFCDDDYATYSALVDELPETNMLKVIGESNYDYMFPKTVKGRESRRKWLNENVYCIEFSSVNVIIQKFKYYINLLNYNIDPNEYYFYIKNLSEYDMEQYQKIKRILETKVQTSEFEALLGNFGEEICLHFIDAF